jgi:hypothetical protein
VDRGVRRLLHLEDDEADDVPVLLRDVEMEHVRFDDAAQVGVGLG